MSQQVRQRADLTYKANKNLGRHGWLRLTPAYSMNLVKEKLESLPKGARVLDPFSGSGTTPLTAQELGLECEAREINPFLVWFGNCKLDEYSETDVDLFSLAAREVAEDTKNSYGKEFWTPPLYKIEKWWSAPILAALASIKHFIDQYSNKVKNLLDIAFCRVMIASSNAAFNHQSMSFKYIEDSETSKEEEKALYLDVIDSFIEECNVISESLSVPLTKTAKIIRGDSTKPFDGFSPVDMVITSPPYANRMSYIRELRPYMYWLSFLENAEDASSLDWETTGGTWGSASTKIKYWESKETIPISSDVDEVCAMILDGKSGEVLSPYVKKYFYDIWNHISEVNKIVKPGGEVCYIVGNSFFSKNEVPTHEWYAAMFNSLGYDTHIDTIRKRNSNKGLFEYAVIGKKH